MKLFSRSDKDEGQVADQTAIFSWGNVYQWNPQSGERTDKIISQYFRFLTPFTVVRKTVNPCTFDFEEGPARWTLMWRRHIESGRMQWRHWWTPKH